jgi:hypothetical protein
VQFPVSSWNTTFVVSVTAVDDTVNEGAHAGLVSHNAVSADPRYSGAAVASVNVQIADDEGVSQPPVASNIAVTTAEDTAVVVTLIANDPDSASLTHTVIGQPAHGTLSPVAGDKVTYTPAQNFNGADSFKFRASDGASNSNTATVTVSVTPANDPPVARHDAAMTLPGTPVNIHVLANDSDVDGNQLSVTSVAAAAHGTAQVQAGGVVRYTPEATFTGTDTFGYTVGDGQGGTATAQVTVNVSAAPPAPKQFIFFSGTVQSMPGGNGDGVWHIQGLTVIAGSYTNVGDGITVGDTVRVYGWISADGVITAGAIKSPGGYGGHDDDDDDDDDRDVRGNAYGHDKDGPGNSNGNGYGHDKARGKGHAKDNRDSD